MHKFEVVPYVQIDGIHTHRDSDIRSLYILMERDGHAVSVFRDGSITNDQDFLRAMKYGENHLYLLYTDKTLGGIIWLNRFESAIARINFCTFNHVPIFERVALGKYSINRLINLRVHDRYVWDAFVGYIPTSNRAAIRFSQAVGMKVNGEIPSAVWNKIKACSEPATIVSYTRGNHDEN